MTVGTVSIHQRILDIVQKHAGITYAELREQLVRRGGDITPAASEELERIFGRAA